MSTTQDINWQVDTLWWIITGLCNLKCKHCYIESPSQKYKQLSFEECLAVINQSYDAGIRNIFITGGEPFVRNDLLKIIAAVYKKGLKILGIETNATLLTQEIINSITDKSIVWHISFDGCQIHEDLRGATGIEDKTIANIKMLINAGFKVTINTTLSFMNKHTLVKTYNLLKDLSIDSWQIFPMANIGNWKAYANNKFTSHDEIQCYLTIFQKWLDDNKPFALSLSNVLTNKRNSDGGYPKTEYSCEYFRSTVTLLPDGVLVPCCRYIAHSQTMQTMQNVFKHSIKDQVADSELKRIKHIKIDDLLLLDHNKNCKECGLLDVCQLGCRISAYLETGNLLHKENRSCSLVKCYYEKYFQQYDFELNKDA